jgi:hypothetical protein
LHRHAQNEVIEPAPLRANSRFFFCLDLHPFDPFPSIVSGFEL